MEERGLVRTAEGENRRIRIEAEDDCGNRSQLEFDILGRHGNASAPKPTARPSSCGPKRRALVRLRAAKSDGPHPRRSGLRTGFLPPGTAPSPRIRLHGRRSSRPPTASSAPNTPLRRPMTVSVRAFVPDEHAVPTRFWRPVRPRDASPASAADTPTAPSRRTTRTTGDTLRRRRHHTAAHPAALQRRGRPRRRPQHPLPRERQFLRHRLLHAAHRRPLGALRPSPDAGYARTCVRPTRRPKTPQRAAHGDGQMRQYSPLGGNILAVNS